MANDLHLLLERIRDLTHAQPEDASEPFLATVEHTLTDGYARALALEGETIRIEKEIGGILANIKNGNAADGLPDLADRLARIESDLTSLRTLLDALRRRAERVRVGA